jgi:dTDP-4-amino-4,6-dideoxygalactose transaminase
MSDVQMQPKLYQNLNINFDAQDIESVVKSFNSTSFSGKSPIISEYEGVIEEYFNIEHAIACCNGTVAIELALRGVGVEAGGRVALPPTAPIMTILPIITMGATPVFCDVAKDGFGPDITDLEVLLQEGIDALITVPMWGYPFDPKPVVDLCRRYGVPIIEDCAHSFGTAVGGKKLGTFGDAAAFSTHERKLVSTGEGGFCLTPRRDVYERMRSWQQHGLSMSRNDGSYTLGEGIGTNYKLSPLCAALGISQFSKLDQKIAARRERIQTLRSKLSTLNTIHEFTRTNGEEINGYAMVFWGPEDTPARAKKLGTYNILSDTTRYSYKPLYQEPAFKRYARACPNAERMVNSIFTLPCHEGLEENDLDYIASIAKAVFEGTDS